MEIRNGFELSNMEAKSLSVGLSTRNNNDGNKSRFIVLGLKMYLMINGRKRYFGDTVRHVLFEDELPGTAMEVLAKYAAKDATGGVLKDQKGGVIIDLQALQKSAEDYELCEPFLDWPGGAVDTYTLKKGPCYANDREGKRSVFNGSPVIRDSIDVLVQVVQYIDGKPKYAPGMSLEGRGQRLENRFWREAVNAQASQQAAHVVQLEQQAQQQPPVTPEPPVQQPDPNQPPF